MSEDKPVWIIIPMHGQNHLTDECIAWTRDRAGIKHKILVVDDCSPDPYQSKWSDVHVLRLKRHSGFTKAVNVGLRAIRNSGYEAVCLLNNDTVPQENFLKALVLFARATPQAGIIGASRIGNREPYLEAGLGADLTTGEVWCTNNQDDFNEPMQGIWIPFCCVLLTEACVESVGLLDEKLINHCSDNDYCLRAIFMDFAVILEPKSKVFHHQSVTINSLSIQPYDDQITFARKWFGVAMNEILEKMPINKPLNKWGRIGFKTETRGGEELNPEPLIIKP